MEHDNDEKKKDFQHEIVVIDLDVNTNRPEGRKKVQNEMVK